jgi:hypothetical protein
VTISSIIQTVIVLILTVVSSGGSAEAHSDGRLADGAWSGNIYSLYLAGSGDNPWALPQTQSYREKPQGPAYQVNPHYVTPEDVKKDSLDETAHVPRKRGSGSTDTPERNYRSRPQELPYGLNYMPGYAMPGYGGYYGGFPVLEGDGAPGFGGDPMLYPYGYSMDMADPYNLMMQPYSPYSDGNGN